MHKAVDIFPQNHQEDLSWQRKPGFIFRVTISGILFVQYDKMSFKNIYLYYVSKLFILVCVFLMNSINFANH